VLQNGYEVTYEVNAPSDCHNILIAPSKEVHFYGEKVTKQTKELECDNYIFQGWEQAESTGVDIFKTNEETFTMPSHNVLYRGTWSTLNIAKSMEGEVAKQTGGFTFEGAVLDNIASEHVTNSTGINFGAINSRTNGQGIYIRAGTENDEHPIYYFRGDKTLLNNVLFANICWKIVRTTETGGLKLIYNGAPSNNQCTNTTGAATQIRTSAFNSSYNNARYVGYMYDASSSIAQHGNTDSTIKTTIDAWYKTNIEDKGYTRYLEDTVWCNDRKINSTSGSYTYYETYNRLVTNKATAKPLVKDEEVCREQNDRYTLPKNEKGNGALTYPVGLLTADEVVLAGGGFGTSNSTYYLYTSQYFWSLSPNYSAGSRAFVFGVRSTGYLSNDGVYDTYGVRPSISLGPGTTFSTGDGSMETPYVVKEG